jgi:FkbH-like protein
MAAFRKAAPDFFRCSVSTLTCGALLAICEAWMFGTESVRLVIWDLDETFWRGTLSEGGICEYVREHHDIVVELARRGIISSICSKNDHAAVETILREHGLWDYFVLPSIDWTAKGPRLKLLVEDIQLRPESILFIDDNPGNRAEAVTHVPDLQIADETIIPQILAHKLFRGKDDSGLTRLKQYQLLQRRKQDEKAAGTDNMAFLRASNVNVAIEPDIARHIDRAIELINRTNQLNFTKNRLPDDKETARQKLLDLVGGGRNQSGLVRVWDDYGDYGFCGVYVVEQYFDADRRLSEYLRHFCFSCRILGMGVENWLYQKLGKPQIETIGEVSFPLSPDGPTDWINQALGGALLFAEGEAGAPPPAIDAGVSQAIAPEIRLWGGCEMDTLSFYFKHEAPKIETVSNYFRGAVQIRMDSTANIALFGSEMSSEVRTAVDALDVFLPPNFRPDFFSSAPPGTLFVLGAWGDLHLDCYRHNTLGFDVHVGVMDGFNQAWNLSTVTDDELASYYKKFPVRDEAKAQVEKVVRELASHYTWLGKPDSAAMRRYWTHILGLIPDDCAVAILLPHTFRDSLSIAKTLIHHAAVLEVASGFANAFVVDITAHLAEPGDQDVLERMNYMTANILTTNERPAGIRGGYLDHFDRMIYFNIYKNLLQEFSAMIPQLPRVRQTPSVTRATAA